MLIGVDGSCLRAVETGKQPSDLPFHLQAQAANLLVNQSLRDWLISAIRDTWLLASEVRMNQGLKEKGQKLLKKRGGVWCPVY